MSFVVGRCSCVFIQIQCKQLWKGKHKFHGETKQEVLRFFVHFDSFKNHNSRWRHENFFRVSLHHKSKPTCDAASRYIHVIIYICAIFNRLNLTQDQNLWLNFWCNLCDFGGWAWIRNDVDRAQLLYHFFTLITASHNFCDVSWESLNINFIN